MPAARDDIAVLETRRVTVFGALGGDSTSVRNKIMDPSLPSFATHRRAPAAAHGSVFDLFGLESPSLSTTAVEAEVDTPKDTMKLPASQVDKEPKREGESVCEKSASALSTAIGLARPFKGVAVVLALSAATAAAFQTPSQASLKPLTVPVVKPSFMPTVPLRRRLPALRSVSTYVEEDVDVDCVGDECDVPVLPTVIGVNETLASTLEAACDLVDLANCNVDTPDWSDLSHVQGPKPPESVVSSLLRDLRTMTLPLFLVWLSNPLLSLIDTATVGSASSLAHLAALGPATAVCDTGTYVFSFVSIVTTGLVANLLAQGDKAEANKVVDDGVLAATVVGGLWSAALLSPFGPRALKFFLPSAAFAAEVLPTALAYARIRTLGFIPALAGGVCQAACLCKRNVKLPLLAVAMSSVLNVLGDYLLVVKMGLGAAGAAWATVGAQAVSFAVLLRHVLKTTPPSAFDRTLSDRVRGLREFLVRCVSPAMALLGKASVMMWLGASVSMCGTVALAAHQILFSMFNLFGPVGEAFSQTVQNLLPAAQVQDSSSLASSPPTRSRGPSRLTPRGRSMVLAVAVGAAALGTVDAAIGGALPTFLPRLFTSSPEVAAALAQIAPTMSMCLLGHALSVTLEGVLFSTNDAKFLGVLYPLNSLVLGVVFAVLRARRAPFQTVWNAYLGYQLSRLAQFGLRILWNQRPIKAEDHDGTKVPLRFRTTEGAPTTKLDFSLDGFDVADSLIDAAMVAPPSTSVAA